MLHCELLVIREYFYSETEIDRDLFLQPESYYTGEICLRLFERRTFRRFRRDE